MNRVLIIEDDSDINNLLREIFERDAYEAVQAYSGTEAQFHLEDCFDLILLDLMLPGLPGEQVLECIRRKGNTPVIIISGKSALDDRLHLLEIGADDYIVKPFETAEVLARARALLRRSGTSGLTNAAEKYEYKGIRIYPDRVEAYFYDEELDLTRTEFQILEVMLKEPEKVHSRDELYTTIRGEEYFGTDNAITVHVSNLRNKLRLKSGEEVIGTVWGVGYKLK